MRIGIIIPAIRGLTDGEYVETIASLGFEATFSETADENYHRTLSKLLEENKIRYETIHAPFDGINAMWTDGGEAMLKRLCHTVDMCSVSGAGIAVVHLSSGENAPQINDIGRARITALVEYANKNKVKIAFENQRKLANLAWAMEAFGESDGVGFCWDCGHESCFTPGREYMPLFADRLICTHIHDNTAVYNSDDHMLPFDGKMDFDKVAEHFRRSGFDGTLMLEVFAKNRIYDGITPEAFLTRAAESAKRLKKMIECNEA